MRRGDVVIVSAQGDYGKPRPAVIVQSDFVSDHVESVIVCLMTGTAKGTEMVRIPVQPAPENGLGQLSFLMVEKLMTMPKQKIAKRIGRIEPEIMTRLDRTLAFVLGLAE